MWRERGRGWGSDLFAFAGMSEQQQPLLLMDKHFFPEGECRLYYCVAALASESAHWREAKISSERALVSMRNCVDGWVDGGDNNTGRGRFNNLGMHAINGSSIQDAKTYLLAVEGQEFQGR